MVPPEIVANPVTVRTLAEKARRCTRHYRHFARYAEFCDAIPRLRASRRIPHVNLIICLCNCEVKGVEYLKSRKQCRAQTEKTVSMICPLRLWRILTNQLDKPV